jgi:hypothetical protein
MVVPFVFGHQWSITFLGGIKTGPLRQEFGSRQINRTAGMITERVRAQMHRLVFFAIIMEKKIRRIISKLILLHSSASSVTCDEYRINFP